ncbi:MAG: hypothetical protein R3D03_06635 [Geminicoccaceae bacterium]
MNTNDRRLSPSEDDCLERLQALLASTAELGRRTRNGETIELDGVLEDIRRLMPEITGLGDPAREMAQRPLFALLEEVNTIVEYLDRECTRARNEVENATTRRQASAAYGSRVIAFPRGAREHD